MRQSSENYRKHHNQVISPRQLPSGTQEVSLCIMVGISAGTQLRGIVMHNGRHIREIHNLKYHCNELCERYHCIA